MQITPVPAPHGPGRRRLLAELDGAAPWAMLRAPAGFDKGLTVRAWLHADARRLASACWIRLAPDDRPDARAFAALLGGRRRIRTVVLDATMAEHALRHAALQGLGAHVRQAIVIAPSARVLPEHLPAMLDARLLDAEELALRPEEVAALVPGIDAADAQRIRDATAGWPALVRFVAARGEHGPTGLAEVVADFVDEQLAPLSPGARTVLSTAGVAAAPTIGLTTELAGLGADEARRAWTELALEGLATVEGTDDGTRWRIVPIVREAHIARLKRDDAAAVRELDRRAARWYAEQAQPLEAASHAVAAEDWDTAIVLLEEHAYELFSRESASVHEIARRIPSEMIETRPVARVVRELLTYTGEPGHVEFVPAATGRRRAGSAVLGTEEFAAALTRNRDDEATVLVGWREAVRVRHTGDFAGAHAFRPAMRVWIADPGASASTQRFVGILYLQSGISAMLAGRFAEAEQDLADATAPSAPPFGPFAQRNAFGDLAMLAAIEGDIPRADENLERMARYPRITGFWARLVRFGELVAEAHVAGERLDLPAARSALDTAARTADRDELWAFYLVAQARIAVAEGTALAALADIAALRRTREHLAGPDSAAAFLLPLAEAEALLATGQAARAGAVLEAAPRHPLLFGVRALQLLQQGAPEEVVAIAGAGMWADEAGPASRALACLARAVAELQLGRDDDASSSFRLAHGLVTRFELRRTLGLLPRSALERLVELTGLPLALEGVPELLPAPARPVALTERERIVLGRLATGAGAGAIAKELFVSENTVRSQLRTLYRKLGVHTREDALAEAARRGLL